MHDPLIDQILERPDAVHHVEYLQRFLHDEQAPRKAFRSWIREDFKAEFINDEIVVHPPVKRRHWKANDLLYRLMSILSKGTAKHDKTTKKQTMLCTVFGNIG